MLRKAVAGENAIEDESRIGESARLNRQRLNTASIRSVCRSQMRKHDVLPFHQPLSWNGTDVSYVVRSISLTICELVAEVADGWMLEGTPQLIDEGISEICSMPGELRQITDKRNW